jgi:putative Mg2+ transporter-C (MgtC) family protein
VGVIRFEREIRDQSAGLRTHILLGLGAALFALASAYGRHVHRGCHAERHTQFDPTRIAAQIVTGIGFLGAGAIIRQGMDIQGLTAAAAAIGMAVGAGYYFGAVATTVVVIIALHALRELRNHLFARFTADFGILRVAFSDVGGGINEVTHTLERHGLQIRSLGTEIEGGKASYTIQVRIPLRRSVQEALEEIPGLPNVDRVSVRGLREVE